MKNENLFYSMIHIKVSTKAAVDALATTTNTAISTTATIVIYLVVISTITASTFIPANIAVVVAPGAPHVTVASSVLSSPCFYRTSDFDAYFLASVPSALTVLPVYTNLNSADTILFSCEVSHQPGVFRSFINNNYDEKQYDTLNYSISILGTYANHLFGFFPL